MNQEKVSFSSWARIYCLLSLTATVFQLESNLCSSWVILLLGEKRRRLSPTRTRKSQIRGSNERAPTAEDWQLLKIQVKNWICQNSAIWQNQLPFILLTCRLLLVDIFRDKIIYHCRASQRLRKTDFFKSRKISKNGIRERFER